LTEVHPKGDRSLAEYDLDVDRHLTKDDDAIADRNVADHDDESKAKIEWDSRIFCLLYPL
jgi:hypothetical protein